MNTMVTLQLNEYLSKDDFPKNGMMRIKFLDEGVMGTAVFDGKEVETFEIGVTLPTGEEKRWTMNKTSQRSVAELYGKDTSTWVGETADLFLSDTNVGGKIKKAIYARGRQ